MIVDDEKPARDRLCNMFLDMPGYEICALAKNGVEAVMVSAHTRPDLILMDIRMPGMDGMEAARHILALDTPPAIIFTTAYEDYAIEAFKIHAAGYLLKPIRLEHLQEVLQAARRLNRAQLETMQQVLEPRVRTHLLVRSRLRCELIPTAQIIYFQAEQKYVTIRHTGGEALFDGALKVLAQEFADDFLRVHRSTLISKRYVSGIKKTADGRYVAFFNAFNGTIEISRRHIAAVRQFLDDRA